MHFVLKKYLKNKNYLFSSKIKTGIGLGILFLNNKIITNTTIFAVKIPNNY